MITYSAPPASYSAHRLPTRHADPLLVDTDYLLDAAAHLPGAPDVTAYLFSGAGYPLADLPPTLERR